MLLALDIGNSATTGGLFDGASLVTWFSIETHDAVADPQILRDAAGETAADISTALAGSVVPRLNDALTNSVRRAFGVGVRFIRTDVPLPLAVDLPQPDQVGDDRLLNALAAHRRAGGAAFVVDFGTAVTVDAVSDDGAYRGGVIAPGIRLAARALHEGTALLPPVEIEAPQTVLGRSSIHAMQSGLTHGIASLVDGLVEKLRAELACPDAPVFTTGGHASLLSGLMRTPCEVVPTLTLDGLCIAHESDRQASESE